MKYRYFFYAILIAIVTLFTACDMYSIPSPPPKEIQGAYWGSMSVLGTSGNVCIEINENSVVLHSDTMGASYSLIKAEKKDGLWLVSCYKPGENTYLPTRHTTLSVNTNVSPYTCKPKIIPMSLFSQFSDCQKGAPYDGRFKK